MEGDSRALAMVRKDESSKPGKPATPPAIPTSPIWWGVSTSAYQTEDPGPPEDGPAFQTDWDLFEKAGRLREGRGNGTRSYTDTERDIGLLKKLGVTHYRFGIEWARVEPEPGVFNTKAIAHYVLLAERLRQEGIIPVVCLWHFTFPSWLSNMTDIKTHGWLHPETKAAWPRYVRTITRELSPTVQLFAPMNEPNSYALAICVGLFPPGAKMGVPFFNQLIDRQAAAFIEAAKIIREERQDATILSIQSIIHWEADAFDWFNLWYNLALSYNYGHLDKIANAVDLVGVNYYQREIASPLALWAQSHRKGDHVSDLGWIIDPAGLTQELLAVQERYGKPIVVMENGIADRGDAKRQRFLRDHVRAVVDARQAGCDVRGYFHWTLIDNFEWMHGYAPKFGLFALSADGREVIEKPSAMHYRSLTGGAARDEALAERSRSKSGL